MLLSKLKKIYYKIKGKEFAECGEDVFWGRVCAFAGKKNIHIGNHVSIGRGAILYSSKAHLYIGNGVMIGPNVSIQTGNHDYKKIGKFMIDIGLDEMDPSCFGDVVIEDDVWIGSGAIITKGVTIGRGSIIHAGCVVSKKVKPYTLYINDKIKINRFSDEQIQEHEKLLKERYGVTYPEYHPKNNSFFS